MDDECKAKYDEIQKGHKHRFVVYHIENDKEIKVEKVGDRSQTIADFFEALQVSEGDKKDCRYGVLDYEFTHEAQGTGASQRDAIILVMYCPENARIKKKMLYSSSFDYVKRAFTGVSVVAPINDDADLTEEFIHEKATERLRK